MTWFVIIAVVLVLSALALILPPLLRTPRSRGLGNEQRLATMAVGLRELDVELAAHAIGSDEYEEAKRELQRQALEADTHDRPGASSGRRAGLVAALTIGITVPLAAAALYAKLGEPAAVAHGTQETASSQHEADIAGMIGQLSNRLKQNPGDAEGWLLLARSYNATGQPQKAAVAYAKVTTLRPKDADLLAEYAYTLALANGRDFDGEPQKLIQRALVLAPDNLNALALAGAAAMQAGKRNDAVRYFTHLKQLLPAGSPHLAEAEALITRAQGNAPPVASNASIRGSVALAPAIASQVNPTDIVYVFARAENGTPMPIAVTRAPASDWPVAFTLDDNHAMTPEQHLSQFPRVDIVARISHTGSANRRPGDLEGRIDNVSLGTDNVKVVIDHLVHN